MNNYISELINEITIAESDAVIGVVESMMDVYDKAQLIEEYVSSDPDYTGYFQESVIDNVKMKEMTDSNKIVSVLKFIPRLIGEIVKKLIASFKKHPEGLTKQEVENVHNTVDQCLKNVEAREKVKKALAVSGCILTVVGGAILISKANKNNSSSGRTLYMASDPNINRKLMKIYIDDQKNTVSIETVDLKKFRKLTKDFTNDKKAKTVSDWEKLTKSIDELYNSSTRVSYDLYKLYDEMNKLTNDFTALKQECDDTNNANIKIKDLDKTDTKRLNECYIHIHAAISQVLDISNAIATFASMSEKQLFSKDTLHAVGISTDVDKTAGDKDIFSAIADKIKGEGDEE